MEKSIKILLVQTGFIGDTILSTPVIDALVALFPNAKISLLTTPVAAPLFQYDSRLEQVLVYDKRKKDKGFFGFIRMLKQLRTYRFDKVFSLHKSYRTSILLFLSRIKERYGFKESKLSFLYTYSTARKGYNHDVLRNLAILLPVESNLDKMSGPLSIKIPMELVDSARQKLSLISGDKLVVISPGSVWLTKRWTEEGFSDLLSQLLANGRKVVTLGGLADIETGLRIESLVLDKSLLEDQYLNLIGKLSLLESAAVISIADVVVANDSAPLHLASAAQVPVAAIFCATVPEFGFGPWRTSHEIIEVPNLQCRPCGRHGHNHCPTGTHFCRNRIGADQVFKAVLRLSDRKISNLS